MNGRMVEMFKYVMTMAPWPGWAQLTKRTLLLLVTTSWADLCSEYSGTGTHLCITMSMIARVCPLPPGQGGVVLTWARVKGWEVAVVRSRQG